MLSLPVGQRPAPGRLGAVLSGWWPVGISRGRTPIAHVKPNEAFASPKGELFWARRYRGKRLGISRLAGLGPDGHRPELEAAGFSFFASLDETPPASLPEARRASLFNWQGALFSRAFCSRKYLPVSPQVFRPAGFMPLRPELTPQANCGDTGEKGGVAAERMFRADLQPPTSKG